MGGVAVYQRAQLISIAKRGQWAVDQTDNLAEVNLRRWPLELVATLGAASALHHASILQLEQNEFEKFFRKLFFVSNVSNANCALIVVTGQHHHGLQSVESFLGDLHRVTLP